MCQHILQHLHICHMIWNFATKCMMDIVERLKVFSLSLCFLWREILVNVLWEVAMKIWQQGPWRRLNQLVLSLSFSLSLSLSLISGRKYYENQEILMKSWKPGSRDPKDIPLHWLVKLTQVDPHLDYLGALKTIVFLKPHIGDKHNALMYLENSDPGLLFRLMANIASHLRFSCILVSQVHLDFNVTIAALIILSTWKPS